MHAGTWGTHTASFLIAVIRYAKGHAQGSRGTALRGHTGESVHSQGLAEAHRAWWRCSTVSSARSQMTTTSQYCCLATLSLVSGDPNWFLIPTKPVWHPEGEMNQQKWQDCWLLVSPSFRKGPLAYLKWMGSIHIYSTSHFCSGIKGALNFKEHIEIKESHRPFLSFLLFFFWHNNNV